MSNACQKPSYLHPASPSGHRKRARVHPFKFSETSIDEDRRKVYLRIKPATGKCNTFVTLDEHTVAPVPGNTLKNRKGMSQQYKFTKIFGPKSQQGTVFKETCISPLNNFLHGGNCLVFAYGATNAGKTFTIQGSQEDPGIIPRALNLLFNSLKGRISNEIKFKPDKINNVLWLSTDDIEKEIELKQSILTFNIDKNKMFRSASTLSMNSESSQLSSNTDQSVICPVFDAMRRNLDDEVIELDEDPSNVYSVWVSYAEIYNENIYDLLQCSKPQKPLLTGVNSLKEVYIKGLTDVCVFSAEEAFKVFRYGRHNLHQAATNINHVSSRSHSIFSVKLVRHMRTECPAFVRLSMCTFVDLAGAERAKKTKNAGERMKESQSINTSLHVLGKCFDALRHNQKSRESATRMLPCRESKLTRLFQRALEGREVLTMIVNINQEEKMLEETLNVLKFSAIAMELQFDRPQDSTFCSLRKSSFSLYMDKFSSTLQSSMGCIEEVPEDTRYMKLLAYIEELKKNVAEEKKKNVTLETKIRKEAYEHFTKIMENMENAHNKRLNDQKDAYAEYEEKTHHLMMNYMEIRKRNRVSDSEGEDEEEDGEDGESENEDSEEKIRFLENKVDALTGLVEAGEQVKQANNSLQTKYSKLQCELAMVKQDLNGALKIQEAMGQGDHDLVVKELQEQLAKTKKVLEERNSELETLNKLVGDAKAEYNEHFQEHEDFAAQNSELEKMVADRDMKIEDLQAQLDICNKKLTQQQQCVNIREFEEADYANRVQQACEARDEFKFKVLQLECELKKLQKENEALKNQPKSPSNSEVKSLELLVSSHEDLLKKYEEKLKNQEKENEILNEEVSILKTQSISSNSDSYEKEISILQSEVKQSLESKRELMDKIEKMAKEFKEVTENLRLAETALTEEQKNTKAMRRICESEKSDILQELQHTRDTVKELEAVKEKLLSENNFLKSQNVELEECSKAKEDQMEALKSKQNAQFEIYENLVKRERELREREEREVQKMRDVLRGQASKRTVSLLSEIQKENQSNFMDVSIKTELEGIPHKLRARNCNLQKPTYQNENVPEPPEDEIPGFFSPRIPIKPDPDTRQLRPRRKKVLYSSEDSKDDLGLMQSKNTRRRQM